MREEHVKELKDKLETAALLIVVSRAVSRFANSKMEVHDDVLFICLERTVDEIGDTKRLGLLSRPGTNRSNF